MNICLIQWSLPAFVTQAWPLWLAPQESFSAVSNETLFPIEMMSVGDTAAAQSVSRSPELTGSVFFPLVTGVITTVCGAILWSTWSESPEGG